MRRSFGKLVFRATLQLTIMLTSTGISANDFMEYKDIDSEQISYETKVQKNLHHAYQDPEFHNDSYQTDQAEEEIALIKR
jgi:hypothetical protein